MKGFSVTIKQFKGFLVAYLVYVIICIFILFNYSKDIIHLWSDGHHSLRLDYFFKIVTYLGDGTFIVILSILLLFWRVNSGLLVFSSYAISGILVQILKRIVQAPRPKLYFEGIYDLHFVEGVKIYTTNSFPSGHSATAFALFLCLAVFIKNKWLQMCLCIAAVVVAYSRIYLSQHFLLDTFVGSAFGVVIAILCIYYYNILNKPWMQHSIVYYWNKHDKKL